MQLADRTDDLPHRLRRWAAVLAALAVVVHALMPLAHGAAPAFALDSLAADLAIHCTAADGAPGQPAQNRPDGERRGCETCICPSIVVAALPAGGAVALRVAVLRPALLGSGDAAPDARFDGHDPHSPRAPPRLA